jgi:hypothetical protein
LKRSGVPPPGRFIFLRTWTPRLFSKLINCGRRKTLPNAEAPHSNTLAAIDIITISKDNLFNIHIEASMKLTVHSKIGLVYFLILVSLGVNANESQKPVLDYDYRLWDEEHYVPKGVEPLNKLTNELALAVRIKVIRFHGFESTTYSTNMQEFLDNYPANAYQKIIEELKILAKGDQNSLEQAAEVSSLFKCRQVANQNAATLEECKIFRKDLFTSKARNHQQKEIKDRAKNALKKFKQMLAAVNRKIKNKSAAAKLPTSEKATEEPVIDPNESKSETDQQQ